MQKKNESIAEINVCVFVQHSNLYINFSFFNETATPASSSSFAYLHRWRICHPVELQVDHWIFWEASEHLQLKPKPMSWPSLRPLSKTFLWQVLGQRDLCISFSPPPLPYLPGKTDTRPGTI